MLETDVNGLCSECAPYFDLELEDDIGELEKSLNALGRINNRMAALGRLETAKQCLERLRPYLEANLARLSRPLPEIIDFLDETEKKIREDEQGETEV